MKEKFPHVYGLLAEYERPGGVLDAARVARREGYKYMDAYTPFAVHGLWEAIGMRRTRLPLIVLVAGICGALTGFFMCWYAQVISYPFNVGGRPLNSWPAYIPITFELTVLFAGVTSAVAMIALNNLPEPYHPLFNVPNFELASRTHFFLCIESRDPQFDMDRTAEFLKGTGATRVSIVPTGRVKPL